VKFEAERALEWLALSPHAPRRLGACLVLGSLARNVPYLLSDYLDAFIDRIGSPLKDTDLATREAARLALREALRLVRAGQGKMISSSSSGSAVGDSSTRTDTSSKVEGGRVEDSRK
jgi:hypothetical protein